MADEANAMDAYLDAAVALVRAYRDAGQTLEQMLDDLGTRTDVRDFDQHVLTALWNSPSRGADSASTS